MTCQHQMWRLMLTVALLNGVNATSSAAPYTKLIVGPKSCLQEQNWDGVTQYTLQFKEFKSKKQARAYQKRVGRFLNAPLYVSYLSASDSYAVVSGPINGIHALHRICKQALLCTEVQSDKPCLSCDTHASDTTQKPKVHAWPTLPMFSGFTRVTPKTTTVIQAPSTSTTAKVKTTSPFFMSLPFSKRTPTDDKVVSQPKSKTYKSIKPEKETTTAAHDFFYKLEHGQPYVGASTGVALNINGVPSTYVGWEGKFFAGYGANFTSWFYLGAEVLGSNNIQVRNWYPKNLPANLRTGWTYGIDLLPGVHINDNGLAYLRLGVISSNFFGTGRDDQTPLTAGQVGIGAQGQVNKNVALRLEYVLSRYQQKTLPFLTEAGYPPPHIFGNEFTVGVVYKFNT